MTTVRRAQANAAESAPPLRVAVTVDLAEIPQAEEALRRLEQLPWIAMEFVEPVSGELVLEGRDFDAAVVLAPRVTERSLTPSLKLVARIGVGFETVDLKACRRRGVFVTITPTAVRRPVASGAVAMLLALAHRLVTKDRLVRDGRWHQKGAYVGVDLGGQTAGYVGFGNIGREIARLLKPWELATLAYTTGTPRPAGSDVEFVPLQELLGRSDMVFVACPLNERTQGLIGREELSLCKPSAYLINIARGAIIDEAALVDALQNGKLAGAGLDVFTEEPIAPDHPLTHMDNVILAPHSIGHLDTLFAVAVDEACAELLAVWEDRSPMNLVQSRLS